MEVISNVPTSRPASKMTSETKMIETGVLTPFFLSQKRAGVLIIARKTAIRKGTTMSTAAFMPATTTTNAAVLTRNRAGPCNPDGIELCG